MIKATFRFFYGSDDNRTLYSYTIELNSLFFTAAFVESNNIVSFLQVAGCDILDVKITEWPNQANFFTLKFKIMEYYAYKGYTIVYNLKTKMYIIYPFNQEYRSLKSAKAWIEYLIK